MKKIVFILLFCLVAFTGFIIKLPRELRNWDKELHFIFYFLAGLFLTIVLAKRKYINHLIILCSLYIFGIFIEACQEASNLFFTKRIHGNFDPEDITYNGAGLLFALVVWTYIYIINELIFNFKNERCK